MEPVGIDNIAVYFPRLYVDMRDFAASRGVDYGKLSRGLGLSAMAIPDVHEDTATMGANAVSRLIDQDGLDPRTIGRLYLGTESALDGAKPTATYILDMLTRRYAPRYGPDCFRHCDVVDMTFACIGAVDAMHNTLDWVARGGIEQDRIGVVVFSDNAKYDLGSTGEYTQGAGSGAVLIRHRPRLMVIPDCWGVSTLPVHDFFKPRRTLDTSELIDSVLQLARDAGAALPEGLSERIVQRLTDDRPEGLLFENARLEVYKDTPVFDGPLSNRCYADSVKTAFCHFRAAAVRSGRLDPEHDPILTEQWKRIILHLPYAFQGKRMFPDVFKHDRQGTPQWQAIVDEIGPPPSADDPERERAEEVYRRKISKTAAFREFVAERIERGQRASSLIGNQYTGSIFLALVSTLESDYIDENDMTGERIGLCGYGSGAKAKVFEGIVQPRWREVAARFGLLDRLTERTAIQWSSYEALHRGTQADSLLPPREEFALMSISSGGEGQLVGERRYAWIP
ncbi:MAG: hydroxymethylglutaryl-CoA synthase [Myxococcota bacterium]|jgi:hydroxymethylglutaryl-CoA synthase